ncbi:cytochrome P450 [Xylaria bambusicola]|uniref:cytochrome P450 n=1 Tax=Xylaria bambusicola TaxID=326684 RepID=UPI00200809C9|nr:cytochrome P450 [Xylaria bambusicola]KAI0513308.1 cytochrome P450 [Xylaria bambusicola]
MSRTGGPLLPRSPSSPHAEKGLFYATSIGIYVRFYRLAFAVVNFLAGNKGAGREYVVRLIKTRVAEEQEKRRNSLQELRREIEEFRGRGLLSDSYSFKETQQMPYLQAVIKEALRMHPATGLPLERVVSEGGATICNHFFPAGTIVGINSWVAYRNT